MKKYQFSIAILFFVLVGIVFCAPFLLESQKIQATLLNRLSRELKLSIVAQDVTWQWLPSPRIILADVRLENNLLNAQVPQAVLTASFLSLFAKEAEIGKLHLYRPWIHVKSWLASTSAEANKPNFADLSKLPRARLIVDNGRLSLDKGLNIPVFKQFGETDLLTGLRADIESSPEKVRFMVVTKTPFAEEMSVAGSFLANDRTYKIDIGLQQLELHKAILPLADNRLIPAESKVNLAAQVEGVATKKFKVKLKGTFPDFLVKLGKTPQRLNCGAVDVDLLVNDSDIVCDIKKIEVKEPGFKLAGRIAQTMPAAKTESAAAPPQPAAPVWHLQLNAADLDVTAIRQAVLNLWGEDAIAKTVCSIVLAGKAKQATYDFTGTVADFAEIEKMTLTVDVDTSTILVPEAELYLTNAKGPIKIEKGLLSGENLSANLDKSTGKNCSLLVGLGERHHDFRLSLDLDADLGALPPILKRLVKHELFQEELARFREINGHALGTLKLGDTFQDIKVEVTARDIKAAGRYDRLFFPIAVEDGEFFLSPTKVAWQDIKATLGPHKILHTDGNVTFSDQTLLDITRLDALTDATALLAELSTLADNCADKKSQPHWRINKSPVVPEAVAKVISKAVGPIEIRNTHIHGPAAFPEKWEYAMHVSLNDFKWTSLLLPGSLTTERASAIITQDQINLTASRSWFLEQPLEINGLFKHQQLADWQGMINISGTVQERAAYWVRAKKWIPEQYFPRIPCTLKGLKITWDHQATAVTGAVMAGNGGMSAPSISLDLVKNDNELNIRKIRFLTPGEQGTLSLALTEKPSREFAVSWQGEVSAPTINALLENNTLLNGKLKGAFTITDKEKDKSFLSGQLTAENTSVLLGLDLKPFLITYAAVTGEQDRIVIDNLALSTQNQTLNIKGNLIPRAEALGISLNLSSNQFSLTATDKLKTKLEEISSKLLPEQPDQTIKPLLLRGDISFNLQAFAVDQEAPADKPADADRLTLILKPVQGKITLHSKELFTTEIRDASLCGIHFNSTFHSNDILGHKSLSLNTDTDKPVLFQDVLSCLQVKQNLLEGPLILTANLQGDSKQWLSGQASLYSTKGNIRRFSLLSKIFRVVNLTDLFSENTRTEQGSKGLPYSIMDIEAQIKDNQMNISKGIIRGDGLNLFGKGKMNLDSLDSDITLLIAPLKTVDSIIAMVPIIGRAIGGANATIVTIPVRISGNIKDPDISVLPAKSVGEGIINLVTDVLKIPFYILEPIIPKNEKSN